MELTYQLYGSGTFCVFLDVEYRFEDTKLITNIHTKITDAHRYLHFNSSHPRHTFYGIVYGQALRYRRIINTDEILCRQLDLLAKYFIGCGYPNDKIIKPVMDKVKSMERCLDYKKPAADGTKPFHIPFLYTYGRGAESIKNFVNGNMNTALKASSLFESDDVPTLKTVYRKSSSIRNLLFNQKQVVLGKSTNKLSRPCTTHDESKHKRGPKCGCCKMMSNEASFILNNTTYECDGGNCKSKNIIYLAICRICNKAYFGKTTQTLQRRFGQHKFSMNNISSLDIITDAEALAAHVALDHHRDDFHSTYKLYVVKSCNPKDLLNNEQQLINKFSTLTPYGLNIDNPIGLPELRVL